jgi:DNA-binding transcriptional LysR family regulator
MRLRRYRDLSMEGMRVLVDLAATGSASKTAENMSLPGPAVVAHRLNKVQEIVGGPLFDKGALGYRPTALGQLTIDYAREMIEANDQLLLLSLRRKESRTIRVGLNNIFVNSFFERAARADVFKRMRFACETSSTLERMLIDDLLDLAVVCRPANRDPLAALAEWREDFVWCRSRSLKLTPGAPIPVLGFVDCALTNIALKALEANDLFGELVFASTDRHALQKAAKAGVGIWPIRPGPLDPSLVVVGRDELPPLPFLTYGVYCKTSFNAQRRCPEIVDMLTAMAPENSRIAANVVGR